MEILLKSVNERPQVFDGPRYLIESSWPKKLEEEDLRPCRWIKEIVPSYELVNTAKTHRWNKKNFREAYWAELERPEAQEAIQRLFNENHRCVTFLYDAPYSLESSANFLKRFLSTRESSMSAALQPVSLAA